MVGAFEYSHTTPEALFPGGETMPSSLSPLASHNPALRTTWKGWSTHTSGTRPYGLDGLYSGSAGLAWRQESGELALYSSFLGSPYYNEEQGSLRGAAGGRRWSLGGSLAVYRNRFSHETLTDRETVFDGSAGCVIKAGPLFMGVSILNAASITGTSLTDSGYGVGIAWQASPMIRVAANARSHRHGITRSWSVTATPTRHFQVSTGYSPDLESYGMSASVAAGNMVLSYGLRSHSALGYTHIVGVTLAASPRFRLSQSDAKPAERVHLNRAKEEELAGIPGVSEKMAHSMSVYRELFGPLTRKSLYQLGMKDADIRHLLQHAYGLAESETRHRRNYSGNYHHRRQQQGKNLFSRLLELGLQPGDALILVQYRMKGDTPAMKMRIESLALDSARKEQVWRLCGIR